MSSSLPDPTRSARPATFDGGAVGRFNAWFFEAFDRYINFVAREHKRAAFDGVRAGDVVEIGAGVGANFDYIPQGSRILAVEPNEAMFERLRRRAEARGAKLELVPAPAEALPLPDASVDEVLCSLVLCTVSDPHQAVREVLRILRPGGRFRFVEHVAAHPASPRRWLQQALVRPWAWLYEGCQLCRHTADVIEAAGFRQVSIERRRFRRSLFFPVNSAIWGIATK
ncbi:MAG: methyltransferase domain-containing protein [Proteobacteria bacterium]|nr:methyltransferase domain-containing protein [Pseudomonadota bacterium]